MNIEQSGESFSIRKVNGRLVLKLLQRRKFKPTPAIKLVNNKFRDASGWAKAMIAIPEVKAFYAARANKKYLSAYSVAVADFLNAPKVHDIDTRNYKGGVGNVITVKATGDFRVAEVAITIMNATGKVLERGKATGVFFETFLWYYVTTMRNPVLTGTKIIATAFHTPGNQTTLEKVL